MLVGAPRNCSRFVCRYGFHVDVLDPLLRTHTSVLLYSDTVCCPGDNSIRLWRMDASRQNSTTTNARSMSYRYTGGNVVSSALRSLTATVKAIVVWNSWSRRYPPQMRENLLPVRIPSEDRRLLHTRRHLYKLPGLLYCGGCTWTRISRQPIIAL